MDKTFDKKTLVESLSPIERKVLPHLSDSFIGVDKISEKSGTDMTTTLRALEFLKNKKLVDLDVKEKKIIQAGINGIYYLKKQLPERRLLNELEKKREIKLDEVGKVCDLNENELRIAFGVLKKKAFIEISSGKIILTASKQELTKKMLEELFLEKLPVEFDLLEPEEKYAFKNLESRKDIISIEDKRIISVKLTELGKEISKSNLDENLIEQLNSKILKTNAWKGKKFRRYDVISPVPRIYGGKKHFVNQTTAYAKKIWIEMGFKEMPYNNMVVSGFWNFDALFTAQDHPVREMQDTFFIKGIEAKLPDKKIVESIKKAHENGMDGSKGWQYNWNEKDAKKVLLRTHTTCLSIQTLKKIAENKEYPSKYFALGKCFRNETVDWSHGVEFNQTEGIVVDENANFRQLLGYLKDFFKKMGYEKIRIRPAYFPYTEPSLEIDIFHPIHKKWVELGGAGMFRPEVTIPIFGRHIPVLAWGPGFDRILMEFFNITDFREIYKNDIAKLRDMKFWKR
ncbi:MAG: phenylalanine--tRNA ligase subunit alpha [Nanoarchaeota archaeon]|nr:phenylalanine--tRNA ligase subunit alpha [Nanoarchaeota archaeon]